MIRNHQRGFAPEIALPMPTDETCEVNFPLINAALLWQPHPARDSIRPAPLPLDHPRHSRQPGQG
jgi:hypothetical protein